MRNIILPIAIVLSGCANAPAMVAKMAPDKLQSVPTPKLCLAYAMHNRPETMGEIERRREFSQEDTELVRTHEIHAGMAQDAAICSWAFKPYFSREGGRQLVYYKSNSVVFVENGLVTNFQQ